MRDVIIVSDFRVWTSVLAWHPGEDRISGNRILEECCIRAYIHALGVNVLIGGNREWGMMARLPQSRSEWCILWRADKSVLSQTEFSV